MKEDLIRRLYELPPSWAFVAVDGNKRAYQAEWEKNPLTPEQLAAEINSGRAQAIGVQGGPASGGLLFIDHDGISATTQLERLGLPVRSLPKTPACTSGRDGRFQLLFSVPEQYWHAMRNRRYWFTGPPDQTSGKPTKIFGPDGKAEQIDFRWANHYSAVAGQHPETSGYRWLKGRSPADIPIAEAPTALIELLLKPADPQPTIPPPPATNTLPLLDFISRTSRDLIESGGAPGAWNDDQLALSLDLIGTEAWIRAQGHTPDITAEQAFDLHITAARALDSSFDERKAWRRFHGAPSHNPHPATPEDKLRSRLTYHTRSPQSGPRSPQSVQGRGEKPPASSPTPFTCLGFDGDSYFYQPAATGQVIRITASGHSGVNLCRLAPLSHWETLYPSKSSVNWTAAASDLFAQQAQIGVYDPDRIRGRGAWWDQGRAILHLGDHLLVNGNRHDLQHGLPGSRYHYQRLAAIDSPTVTPLTDPEAYEILDLANRFHWDVPASGLLLAGWVTLAPICGALDWRPHAWLTAAAGTGKSELLNKFIGPLLGPISLWPLGSSTEAFLRQELRCDALPVVFDEAESNEQNDKARIQAVLALARVASSSGRGVVGRGSADGQAQRFTIRSMFLLSSISTALKQGADRTRFAQLSLRNPSELPPEQRAAHWTALKADLERIISETTGHRLQARTIALIPIIRQSTAIFRDAAGAYFQNQRLGDQYGTLLAGAYALQCSTVPTPADALTLIRQQNWEPYQQATELTDEQACLQTLLQHQLRIESRDGALTRTVAELVEIAARRTTTLQIEASTAEDLLGRHGFRVQEDQLLISNTATAIEKILAVTPWASCWPMTLVRIDGATRPGIARFKGIGVSRCVGIPLQTVTV